MKKISQKYTAKAAEIADWKYYKFAWIVVLVGFILFLIMACFKGKIIESLTEDVSGIVVFLIVYLTGGLLCKKGLIIWLSLIIALIVGIVVGVLCLTWLVIAEAYIIR